MGGRSNLFGNREIARRGGTTNSERLKCGTLNSARPTDAMWPNMQVVMFGQSALQQLSAGASSTRDEVALFA